MVVMASSLSFQTADLSPFTTASPTASSSFAIASSPDGAVEFNATGSSLSAADAAAEGAELAVLGLGLALLGLLPEAAGVLPAGAAVAGRLAGGGGTERCPGEGGADASCVSSPDMAACAMDVSFFFFASSTPLSAFSKGPMLPAFAATSAKQAIAASLSAGVGSSTHFARRGNRPLWSRFTNGSSRDLMVCTRNLRVSCFTFGLVCERAAWMSSTTSGS
mmetsp:Transcript_27719/g.65847  ORF Transcript_27719/g.65847 Transcript_27719/m.65847 type:complete len:220 (-) Transcript_27719:773-1432(-)